MPTPAETRFLVFSASGCRFALPLTDVREVLPMVALAPAVAAPPFVTGLLDVFPDVAPIPVVRLDALLGLPPDADVPGRHTPLVVCRGAGARPETALIVRRVEGIDDTRPEPLSDDGATFNGCVAGILPGNGADPVPSASVLSLARLFLREEEERLRDFARRARERRGEEEAAQDAAAAVPAP